MYRFTEGQASWALAVLPFVLGGAHPVGPSWRGEHLLRDGPCLLLPVSALRGNSDSQVTDRVTQ